MCIVLYCTRLDITQRTLKCCFVWLPDKCCLSDSDTERYVGLVRLCKNHQ